MLFHRNGHRINKIKIALDKKKIKKKLPWTFRELNL